MLAFHRHSGVYIIGTQSWNTSSVPWNTVTAQMSVGVGNNVLYCEFHLEGFGKNVLYGSYLNILFEWNQELFGLSLSEWS